MKFRAMFFVLCVALSSFAFAKPKKMDKPAWYPAPRNVYSLAEYLITEVPGSGDSEEQAKNSAVNSLAGFVSTQVQSTLETNFASHQENAKGRTKSKETTDVSRDINLNVDVTLYALETTDAYYDKATKTWYVCAFINREKAFDAIQSDLEAAKNKFYGFYENAKTAEDVFEAIRHYEASKTAGNEFLSKIAYASLFNATKVNQIYGEDAKTASSVQGIIKKLKVETPLQIKVENDFNKMIFAVTTDVFKENGWSVSENAESLYEINVKVDANIETQNNGIDTNTGKPLLLYISTSSNATITLFNTATSKTLYAFNIASPENKVVAYNLQKVQNKVYAILSTAIRKTLPDDFENFMLGGE